MKINLKSKKQKNKITNTPLINQNPNQNSLKLISTSANRINQIQYNSFLSSLKHKVDVNTRIIEKISINYPITAKTLESRMGKGKGGFNHCIAKIRPNQIILEIFIEETGINYKKFLKLAGMKLPIRYKILDKLTF